MVVAVAVVDAVAKKRTRAILIPEVVTLYEKVPPCLGFILPLIVSFCRDGLKEKNTYKLSYL